MRESRSPSHLERSTEPPDLVEADKGASEGGKGEVDVCAALVAHSQAPEAIEPRQCMLHHPPVPPEALAAFHASTRDAGRDAALAALATAAPMVVALVRVELVRAPSRAAPLARAHRRNGVQCRREHDAVVAVGPAQSHAERRAARVRPKAGQTDVHNKVALGARLATVRGRRAHGTREPVASPSFSRPRWRCPARRGASPTALRLPARFGAGRPTRSPLASRATCASNSSRSHTLPWRAGTPTASRS